MAAPANLRIVVWHFLFSNFLALLQKEKIKFNYFAGVLFSSLVFDAFTRGPYYKRLGIQFYLPIRKSLPWRYPKPKNYFLMNALDLLIVFLTLILLIYFYTKDKNVLFELFKS